MGTMATAQEVSLVTATKAPPPWLQAAVSSWSLRISWETASRKELRSSFCVIPQTPRERYHQPKSHTASAAPRTHWLLQWMRDLRTAGDQRSGQGWRLSGQGRQCLRSLCAEDTTEAWWTQQLPIFPLWKSLISYPGTFLGVCVKLLTKSHLVTPRLRDF